jgi:hypothetical protein
MARGLFLPEPYSLVTMAKMVFVTTTWTLFVTVVFLLCLHGSHLPSHFLQSYEMPSSFRFLSRNALKSSLPRSLLQSKQDTRMFSRWLLPLSTNGLTCSRVASMKSSILLQKQQRQRSLPPNNRSLILFRSVEFRRDRTIGHFLSSIE